jgi:excisionase family DNA binding protein
MSEYEALKQEIQELKTITLISSKDVLTTEEAAMYMGISKDYLYKLCQKLQIVFHNSKGGKKIYFKKKDLNEWMLHSKSITQKEIEAKAKRFIN